QVHQRFTRGMDRVEKVNLLLEREDGRAIWARLLQAHPDEIAAKRELVRYEEDRHGGEGTAGGDTDPMGRGAPSGAMPWPAVGTVSPGAEWTGLLPGQAIGNYRVGRKLGAGGMGLVYEGRNEDIGARVAIKVLHPHYARDPVVLTRFLNEA